jgi:hypothetical protein
MNIFFLLLILLFTTVLVVNLLVNIIQLFNMIQNMFLKIFLQQYFNKKQIQQWFWKTTKILVNKHRKEFLRGKGILLQVVILLSQRISNSNKSIRFIYFLPDFQILLIYCQFNYKSCHTRIPRIRCYSLLSDDGQIV